MQGNFATVFDQNSVQCVAVTPYFGSLMHIFYGEQNGDSRANWTVFLSS